MMKEVESGKVGTILIKDMSRMGRDYLKVGQYMELLRQNNVRLIAVNENVDSFREDDDFTPFRNIMNEWYARDTSKKIKSTFKAKGKSGKHVASTTPYGYLKDKDDPNVWIVDEEAAVVVRRIFHMTMDGYGPYQIARTLKEDKVEIPAVHMAKKDAGLWKGRVEEIKDPYGWGSSTVAGILKKREYLGHTVNFKTRKHFKDKKSHYVSEDNWTVFENTQEAIIDQETFDNVQRIRSNVRRYPDGWGEAHPLTGLMYCADCGSKMYVHRVNNGKRVPQYTCSAYSKVPVGTLCQTQHRINADVVMELIKELLKAVAEYSQLNREEFLETVKKAQTSQQSSEITRLKNRLAEAKKRVQELEKLICYCLDRDVVTAEDVEAVCTTRITNHIFDMVNAIAEKQPQKALQLYYDLLALKEPPMRVLFLIARQCNLLLQTKELKNRGHDNKTIASKIGVPPFAAGKYVAQASHFKTSVLKNAVKQCVETEEAVKSGRMNDMMSVEILILSVLPS